MSDIQRAIREKVSENISKSITDLKMLNYLYKTSQKITSNKWDGAKFVGNDALAIFEAEVLGVTLEIKALYTYDPSINNVTEHASFVKMRVKE